MICDANGFARRLTKLNHPDAGAEHQIHDTIAPPSKCCFDIAAILTNFSIGL